MSVSHADPLFCFTVGVTLHVKILSPILVYISYHALGIFLCSNPYKEKASITVSFMRITSNWYNQNDCLSLAQNILSLS